MTATNNHRHSSTGKGPSQPVDERAVALDSTEKDISASTPLRRHKNRMALMERVLGGRTTNGGESPLLPSVSPQAEALADKLKALAGVKDTAALAAACLPEGFSERQLTEKPGLLDTRRYVGADRHVRIDRDDWRALQAHFAGRGGRNQLVQFLDDIVTQNRIGPPLRMVSTVEAIKEFSALKALPTADLLDAYRTNARFNYLHPLGVLAIEANNTGALTCDYFFQEIRWTCAGGRVGSPTESWADPESRRHVFHNLLDADVPYVDRHRIRKHLGTRRYIPTPYRPAVAKAIFDLFKPETVLDMSFGWGERMAAFEACESAKVYYGIDPDRRVLEAGRRMHEFCNTGKAVELFNSPAEDFAYDILDPVDMLYFSPPPFTTERYADEPTQACVRYRDTTAFVHKFLFEAIRKAWDTLKPGGVLALDLGDLRAGRHEHVQGDRHCLVEPLLQLLSKELPDYVFRGSVGAMVGHNKPTEPFAPVRVDPIWIITKGACNAAARGLLGRKSKR